MTGGQRPHTVGAGSSRPRRNKQPINRSRNQSPVSPVKSPNITTYPYDFTDGLPTYETDYMKYGQDPNAKKLQVPSRIVTHATPAPPPPAPAPVPAPPQSHQRAQTADPTMKRRKPKFTANPALPVATLADGTVMPRPPLSRSTSYGDLGQIKLTGSNFKTPSKIQMDNFKKGLRLSKCYDNVSSYGSREWTTCNQEYGSVNDPSVLRLKRHGVMSFENSRFLPNHPHWKDRPYKPGDYIKCPKSTYSDLGSYYIDGFGLPPEYQWTRSRARRLREKSLTRE